MKKRRCFFIIVILFFLTSSAYAITSAGIEAPKQAAPGNGPGGPADKKVEDVTPQGVVQQMENIILQKIEDGFVFSKDGRKFPMSSETRIIDNGRHQGRRSSVRTAQLYFIGGKLATIIIK